MTSGSRVRRGGIAAALAAALALTLTVGFVTARASAAPDLPPVPPEELVASVLEAEPVALAGTVAVDNRLGLPAVPGVPAEGLTDGTSTARVWSDGDGRGRLALPRPDGERTYVRDGTVTWAYDSTERTATRIPARGHDGSGPDRSAPADRDPQAAAREVVGKLRDSSVVGVDGTTEIAGRPAYTLVLAPQPGARTVLREVRAAVDAETRTPLELTVLGAGPEPVLRIGFDDVTFGPQDPALFTFTPPPGVTVEDKAAEGKGSEGKGSEGWGTGPDDAAPGREHHPERGGADAPRKVGDGWDAVVVGTVPQGSDRPGSDRPGSDPQATDPPATDPQGADRPDLSALGTPVSGPWGSGREITTNAGSAILTDDGRFAAGAVGTDVLGAALQQ